MRISQNVAAEANGGAVGGKDAAVKTKTSQMKIRRLKLTARMKPKAQQCQKPMMRAPAQRRKNHAVPAGVVALLVIMRQLPIQTKLLLRATRIRATRIRVARIRVAI